MRRPISLIALLVLAFAAPAYAQSFGKTTAGTVPSDGLRADYKRGSKFALTEQGTVTQLCAYLDGQDGVSSTQSVRLALYRDASGVPSTKVGESATRTIAAGAAASWVCLDTPYLVVAPGNYWIMLHSGGTAGVARYYSDGPANWYGNADAFADGASDPFGAGGTGTGTLSVYAAYADSSELAHAGRTTVGSTPSGGMRADYKRGSKFHLSGYGRAKSLSVYLDGLGGGTGSQSVTLALYWDSQGVPSSLSIYKANLTVPAGMKPQWVTVPIPPYVFEWSPTGPTEADLWFTLHSGSNAGVARFYSDGSGNWCGHSDLYSDGTSSSFGSCDAGNGTISGFLSYEPGEFSNGGLIGNTADPATALPSSGMTANYIRLSKFTVTDPSASIRFLYGYFDGLGGGTGSQQVKMVIYDDSPGHKLVGESYPTTITAGAAPSWAIFDLTQPARLPPGDYYIGYFTGTNAGVARNYATSTPNWLGIAANYATGAPTILDPPPADAATGSVTLVLYGELITQVSE